MEGSLAKRKEKKELKLGRTWETCAPKSNQLIVQKYSAITDQS